MKLLGFLAGGAVISLQVFLLTLLFALPLGLIISFGSMSKKPWVNWPIKEYILIMRGTPLLLQLMFVYFAPSYLFNAKIDRFAAAIIAFSLNYAAYFSEIFRGGIEAIPHGQYEAAEVLGFTKTQTFFQIILPQVIKRILPAISNEIITLVKDTALIHVLGIRELFRVAQNESSRLFSVMPLFVAGIFYYVMNWVVTKILHFAEKKLSYYR